METITLVTWNTQGNAFADGKINHLINTYHPDIICLQECGNLDGTRVVFQDGYSAGRIRRGTYEHGIRSGIKYNVFFYPWGRIGRCSMAVMVNSQFNVSDYSLISLYFQKEDDSYEDIISETTDMRGDEDYVEERKGLRSMLRVNIRHEDDDISINNVHLPSGRPSFARKVGYEFIDDCFNNCSRNIIIIGDMNTLPDSWRYPYSLRVTAPTIYTHTCGKILDYMFTNMSKLYVEVDDDFHSSDHLAVFYELQLTC